MLIGAKHYRGVIALALLAGGGCADLRLARFAPPGIVKYENLAKDQPPNPKIVERVEAVKDAGDSRFPRLAEQPQVRPATIPPREREAEAAVLRESRDMLAASVAEARATAAAERADGAAGPSNLDEAATALGEAVDRADAEARRERGLPPRPPKPAEPPTTPDPQGEQIRPQ